MIMQHLRTTTRTWHTDLEAAPFSLSLVDLTLPLERYVGQLAAYRAVLGSLETELAGSSDPIVTAVWRPELAKVSLLDQDLEYFGVQPVGVPEPARRFARTIHDQAAAVPVSMLGFLYVLEGSTLGGLELTPCVRAAYRLTGDDGVRYYSCGDRQRWGAFAGRMDAAVVGDGPQQAVLAAAVLGYQAIAEILADLSGRIEV